MAHLARAWPRSGTKTDKDGHDGDGGPGTANAEVPARQPLARRRRAASAAADILLIAR